MTALVLIVALAAGVGLYIIVHNGLARAVTLVEQGWSGVEVQLKRRHDLVPGLVMAARTARLHESTVFERILATRSAAVEAMAGHDPARIARAEAALAGALQGLRVLVEDNPAITATAHLGKLQAQLEETEDQIAAARRLYNGNVQHLNARIATFPGNLVARLHRFRPAHSFAMTEAERAVAYDRPTIDP